MVGGHKNYRRRFPPAPDQRVSRIVKVVPRARRGQVIPSGN